MFGPQLTAVTFISVPFRAARPVTRSLDYRIDLGETGSGDSNHRRLAPVGDVFAETEADELKEQAREAISQEVQREAGAQSQDGVE